MTPGTSSAQSGQGERGRGSRRGRPGRCTPASMSTRSTMHALLGWEKEAILKLAEQWGGIDRSHRKLAHRGSRLGAVYVSESSVLRVLIEAGVHLPGRPRREPRPRSPWPDWAELVPGVIWVYDFTHFTRLPTYSVIAVIDVVSRYWLSTIVSVQETSTQVQNALIDALIADGKEHLLEEDLLAELHSGHIPDDVGRLPVLLALS